MVSVIIPIHQDTEYLHSVIRNLCDGQYLKSFEIILVNDGSRQGNTKPLIIDPKEYQYPNVRVINYPVRRGVGFAFDLGVSQAIGDTIVLMGNDVIARRLSWLNDVENAVKNYPDTIGCSASIGLSPDNLDLDKENKTVRYGANLLIQVGVDDLPKDSKLRKEKPNYTSIMDGQWRKKEEKTSESPYEIPCLMGAFYFCTKEYYTKVGGWDTDVRERWQGHKTYGHLEPYISLKSWLVGGGVTMFPQIEAGHIFNRIDKRKRFQKGCRSYVDIWWNAIFAIETQVMDENTRKKILGFVRLEKNYSAALQAIRKNYGNVLKIRERNKTIFTHDFQWFLDRFGVILK